MNKHASMNRIFRLVWNESLNAYVPAAETARGRGKSSKRKLVAAALSLSATIAQAGPTGGQVTGGSGTITQSGSTTTIQQASQNLSLNWKTFNIAPQETVDFVQPNSSAIAVNRILGTNGSVILGHLNANGQVYLINPNGVLFGKGAEVNLGGLVASTLNLDDSTLGLASKKFSGAGAGSIINDGTLTAATGGTIALLGNHVSNNGVISAQLGTVALGAGSAATLTFHGTNLVSMQIDQSVLNSVASNGGLIRADGGQVLMTAGAQKALLVSVVNNTGVIEARTLENHEGTITLLGSMTAGTVNFGGTIDASAPAGGSGGFIETSAEHVKVANAAKVTTAAALGLNGTWLIDPVDFTVAATGGDETGAALSSALSGGNVQIQSSSGATGTSGNINVNDNVTWSANTLTLTAQNNININSPMNGSGTASLALQYGQGDVSANNSSLYHVTAPVNLPAGPNFSTKLGSDGIVTNFTVITSLGVASDATTAPGTASLQGTAASGNLGGNFVLGADINAGVTASWNSGAGFTPIGANNNASFTGTFDGLDHTISDLTIDRPTTNNVGLFGYTHPSATIQNLTLSSGSVAGAYYSGMVVGYNRGSMSNLTVNGTVSATGGTDKGTGGVAGVNYGSLQNGNANATVNGRDDVGGLVGLNEGSIGASFASGSVTSTDHYAGGLVGENPGSVSGSHATGSVSGVSWVGGLTGGTGGSIASSYATGTVTGTGTYIGGLTGLLNGDYSGSTLLPGSISNSYSTGNVNGPLEVGGLVGLIVEQSHATLSNSFYDAGAVLINGVHELTAGGIYHAQYSDWFTHSEVLSIGNYSATLPIGSGGFYDVSSVQGFEDMQGFVESNAALSFRMTANISLPQGVYAPYFAGSFDGGGFTISNASVVFSNSNLGLFGYLPSGSTSIENLAVSNATVTGRNYVGGLVGDSELGVTIGGSSFSGTVSGGKNVGGLEGYSPSATNSISNSYFSGSVTGTSVFEFVGGLIGENHGSIATSFATGSVTAAGYGGGLVGYNDTTAHISNSYFSGSVNGGQYAGGLAGANYGFIDKSYARGPVTSIGYAGGLVGNSSGTVTNSFYDKSSNPTLTGLNYSGPIADVPGQVIGLTATQMMTLSNFTSAGWDFTGPTWVIYDGQTSPLLRFFLTPLTVTATSVSRYYDATANGNEGGVTYTTSIGDGQVLGTAAFSGSSQGAVHAGSYVITPNGLYSDQLGYLISYASGALTIIPAPLTVSGTTVGTKTYNGTIASQLSGGVLVGVVGGDTVTLTQSGSFASKNVGTGIAVTATDGLVGAQASDYTIIEPTNLSGTITPAILTVSGTTIGSKVYDGTTVAALNGGSLVGLIGGDTVTLTQAGSFVSKNAGTGMDVTAADSLGGAAAGNYTIVEPSGLSGTITPATLTVSGTTVGSKVYNGTAVAPLSGGTLVGVIGADTVTLTQAGSFVSKNVGTGMAITAADALGGAQASDYMIIEPISLSGTITPATLTVIGTTVRSKVYNGTTVAPLTGGSLVGIVGSDTVTLTQAGSFVSKNAGTGIAVTAADSLGGAAAGNYTIVEPSGLSGNITPATLTVSGTAVGSKIYNGTSAAPLAGGALVGVVSGDTVTLNQSGMFASTSPGTGIAVTATDSLSGASTIDYSIVEPVGLTGSILPASGAPNGSTDLVVAALNARTQTVENFIYPQLGANPQVINPSPTIAVLSTAADGASVATTGSHQALAVNVSMKIGANGTLKIENGGLRLPSNLIVGNE